MGKGYPPRRETKRWMYENSFVLWVESEATDPNAKAIYLILSTLWNISLYYFTSGALGLLKILRDSML